MFFAKKGDPCTLARISPTHAPSWPPQLSPLPSPLPDARAPHPCPTDDASLTTALQSRIAGDGALSTESIQSSVQKQVATLNGTVSNEAARSLAAADAAQVPGIKTVVNNLTVQAPAPPATAAVAPPPPLPAPPAPAAPKQKQPPAPKPKSAPIVRQPAPVEPPPPQAADVAPPPPVQQAPPPPPPPPPPCLP